MVTPPNNPPGTPPSPEAKFRSAPIFQATLNELNVNADQFSRRQKLIAEIESVLSARFNALNRLVSYVLRFGHSRTLMTTTDVPHLEAALDSITGAEQINVLLHSPGGDGSVIEKMVNMCRRHMTGQNTKFRIIVPNVAKSAATVLALGADQILMGYCSELGPIDPQVPIVVSGITQWVSAWAFVEARNNLMEQINTASGANEPVIGLLQQLGGLNIPFIMEMENQIGFARKTAITLLDKYMLKTKHPDPPTRATECTAIADKLLSKELFPSHGQYIDAATAKGLGLEVEVLDKEDNLWKLIWDYYIRCEVQMNIPLAAGLIKTKLFESGKGVSLVTQDVAG
jgi:Serine dehydrogenase proteinase